MKEDTLRKLVAFFFRYLWLVCGALIAVNLCSMLLTAYGIVKDGAEEALRAAGTELSRSVTVNYDLLESLKDLPLLGDTSIPVQDRALALRPFVQPFGLWMIGVVDPDGSISSTLRYKSAKVERDYIPRILLTGQREMTDVFHAGATGELNYTLLVPVKRDDKVVSIVFVATRLREVQEMLQRNAYDSDSYFLLLDGGQNVIAHPWSGMLFKNMFDLMDQEWLFGSTQEEARELFSEQKPGAFLSVFNRTLYYTLCMPLKDTPWMLIHRIRLIPTLQSTLISFSLQAFLYLLIFGLLYFFGNAYILRQIEPMDFVLKQIIVLNKAVHNSNILTDKDAETLLTLSRKGLKDELTGLPTRMLFRQMLNAKLHDCPPSSLCAVFYIDMDNLKSINDEFGHSYGDEAICRFGEGLQDVATRHAGLCSRYGGDEFLLFVENLKSQEKAAAIAAELLATLRGTLNKDGEERSYHASIGYSLYPLQTGHIDLAIQFADIALYEAKQRGKNTFALYTPEVE